MATNSRHRKDHKKKLAARKNRLAQEKVQAQKYQKEFIMNLIKQEQEKGLFDNTPNIHSIDGSGPIIEGPAI
jgi:uncharacterized protein YjgD (DUF1641 family)